MWPVLKLVGLADFTSSTGLLNSHSISTAWSTKSTTNFRVSSTCLWFRFDHNSQPPPQLIQSTGLVKTIYQILGIYKYKTWYYVYDNVERFKYHCRRLEFHPSQKPQLTSNWPLKSWSPSSLEPGKSNFWTNWKFVNISNYHLTMKPITKKKN